jgi:hypothetical protein
MPKPAGCEWAIFYDSVHIFTVNYTKGEARLFENAGSTEGQLLFAKDEAVAKLPISDPFQLISLALNFAIRYELIAHVAESETLQILEQLGVKDLLDRVQNLTTEADRHRQLQGLGLKFNTTRTDNKSDVAARKRTGKPTTIDSNQPASETTVAANAAAS